MHLPIAQVAAFAEASRSRSRFISEVRDYNRRLELAGSRIFSSGITGANQRIIERLVANGGNFWPDSGAFNAMAGYLYPGNGANLIPLKDGHDAGTLNEFVTGDWNAVTGLMGDGIKKYVNLNRANNEDGQDDQLLFGYTESASTSFSGNSSPFSSSLSMVGPDASNSISISGSSTMAQNLSYIDISLAYSSVYSGPSDPQPYGSSSTRFLVYVVWDGSKAELSYTSYDNATSDVYETDSIHASVPSWAVDEWNAETLDPRMGAGVYADFYWDSNSRNTITLWSLNAEPEPPADIGAGGVNAGRSFISYDDSEGGFVATSRNSVNSGSLTGTGTGFIAISRAAAANYLFRFNGSNNTITSTSQTPTADHLYAFARNNGAGTAEAFSDTRMSILGAGGNLNGTGELAELDSIITDWHTDLANA